MNAILRDIELEPRAQKELDSSRKKFKRIDDVYKSLCWRLAREPEEGVVRYTEGPLVLVMKLDPDSDPELQIPGIAVVYCYNKEKIFIIDMRIDPPPIVKKKR